VPADRSSPIPAALTQLIHADRGQLQDAEAPDLLAYLASVPDPRAARGRRHPLVAILGLAAAAVLAGARSIAAIAEWAADAPQPVRAALGARHHAPGHCSVPAEATIRRTLSRLDADVLAGAIGAWLADRDRHRDRDRPGPTTCRRAVAVDGKTLRGARPPTPGDGRPVHLLACMDHATRAVLAQRQVGGAPEEVPAFAPLLADLDLAGVVVTADALQTHPEAAEFLVTSKRAHYLFTVKANQPTLLGRCARLPWHRVPVADRTRDRGHGRVELRTLKVVGVRHFGFPHTAQVLQVTRKTRQLHTNRWRVVTVYAVTSLPFELARPARLADLLRGHWAIEALHHIRDVTFAEDASQVRTGSGPSVMAALRNLTIGVLCRAGPTNLAAALRHHARDPHRPLASLGISLG
jgi:predicted transposase YbfD/YdcC